MEIITDLFREVNSMPTKESQNIRALLYKAAYNALAVATVAALVWAVSGVLNMTVTVG